MKKTHSLLLCLALLLGICFLLSSCGGKTTNPIDFDEKYIKNDYAYYLFHADGTGEYVTEYTFDYPNDPTLNHTLSGTVEFVWREASDGAIYLFKTVERYNENHTEGHTIGIFDEPIYFGEDFFACTIDNSTGSSTHIYVVEGSKLDLSAEQ